MICSLIDSFSIGVNMQQVKLEIAAFFFSHVHAAPRKTSRGEDSDQLTDLFATLFGPHCTVGTVCQQSYTTSGKCPSRRPFL